MKWANRKSILEVVKTAGILFGSFLLYYLASNLGLNFATINKQASPVWPATGIAISLLYLLGPQATIGIFLAAAFSNYQIGTPVPASILIGAGNTLEAVTAVLFFKYLMKSKIEFGSQSSSVFASFSLACAAAVSATVGTVTLYNFGIIQQDLTFTNWTTWWIGDLLGGLFIIPFAFRASIFKFKSIERVKYKYAKVFVLLAITTLINYFVFNSHYGSPYLFLVFLPLLVAAAWFDSLLIYVTSFLIFSWALSATVLGHGPFAGQVLNESLIHLQLFLLGLGLTSLGFGGLRGTSFNHRIMTALLFGWTLAGLTFFSFYKSAQEVDRSHFQMKVDQAQLFLEMQLNDYATLMQSSIGFFNATDRVTQKEWSIFSKKLLLNREFEKVEGIGIIFPSRTATTTEFYKENHISKPIPNLRIHKPQIIPEGYEEKNPEVHLIASYIEPFNLNKLAVGIDISAEKNRYKAALQARDTGLPTITDNIVLFQNKVSGTAGFILFIPFYRKYLSLNTVQQRRKAFAGLVFSPVVANKFFSRISEKFDQDLIMEVYMGSEVDATHKIFAPNKPSIEPDNKMIKSTQLLGKKMTFVWRKAQSFEHTSGLIFSLISFFGATVTLLLAVMLSSLQNTTRKAQTIADEKTKEITEKNIIWKNLTETAPVGIYLTDKLGYATYMNKQLIEMTGLSLSDVQKDGWMNSIYEDDVELVTKNWQNMLLTGKFSCSYRFYNSTKEIIHISSRSVALKNHENEVTGYLGIMQDVTAAMIKRNALIASSRLSSLGEMASGIAHEINNPLSIILGKAFLLQSLASTEDFDASKVKMFAQQIADTVQRISKIIRGLRAFARETTGEPFETCSISDVVSETLELCRERFRSYQIDLIIPPFIDPKIFFCGRSEQIAQVLLNLLNNAFDATLEAVNSPSKWVRLDLAVIGKKIIIKVSNSGQLIRDSQATKIFDPFYTTKQVGKGTGLGLSISKGIIESHQGAIFVDLKAPHTTFVIELNVLPVSKFDINKLI